VGDGRGSAQLYVRSPIDRDRGIRKSSNFLLFSDLREHLFAVELLPLLARFCARGGLTKEIRYARSHLLDRYPGSCGGRLNSTVSLRWRLAVNILTRSALFLALVTGSSAMFALPYLTIQ
jgi:hypothetical protein